MSMDYREKFKILTTPQVADASLRLGVPLRLAKSGIRSVAPGQKIAGRVLPVKHFGSVDVFLEAIHFASQGDVLVIDNQGRFDEGCIGDSTILEAKVKGLAGVIIWGTHRDTAELIELDFPVFSYGSYPSGPVRLDERTDDAFGEIKFGDITVSKNDFVLADSDGVLFAPCDRAEDLAEAANAIRETERRQAELIRQGQTLYQQLKFDEFISKRDENPKFTFREHLRAIGGAIEE